MLIRCAPDPPCARLSVLNKELGVAQYAETLKRVIFRRELDLVKRIEGL